MIAVIHFEKFILSTLLLTIGHLSLAQIELPDILENKNIKSFSVYEKTDGLDHLKAFVTLNRRGQITLVHHGNYFSEYVYKRRKLQYIATQYSHPVDSKKNFNYKKYYMQVDSATIIDSTIMNRTTYSDTIVRFYHPVVMNQIPYVSPYFTVSNAELKQSYIVESEGLFEAKLDSTGVLQWTSYQGETYSQGCVEWTDVFQTYYKFNEMGLLISAISKTSSRITGEKKMYYSDDHLLISWTEEAIDKPLQKFSVNYIFYK